MKWMERGSFACGWEDRDGNGKGVGGAFDGVGTDGVDDDGGCDDGGDEAMDG